MLAIVSELVLTLNSLIYWKLVRFKSIRIGNSARSLYNLLRRSWPRASRSKRASVTFHASWLTSLKLKPMAHGFVWSSLRKYKWEWVSTVLRNLFSRSKRMALGTRFRSIKQASEWSLKQDSEWESKNESLWSSPHQEITPIYRHNFSYYRS